MTNDDLLQENTELRDTLLVLRQMIDDALADGESDDIDLEDVGEDDAE